jgi:hydrophobe/amphiphile efflux-3 (HAE3) family protein
MLTTIGNLVEHHPWPIIGIVLLITIGFGSLMPSLEMETSMSTFLPDDPVVNANERIGDYFGMGYEMLMIDIENEGVASVVDPQALREAYSIGKKLSVHDDTEGFIGVPTFVDTDSFLEFGTSLENCTNEQIATAFNDLMYIPRNSTVAMLSSDDTNEPTDFKTFQRIGRGKSLDSIDIKNYFITKDGDQLVFSIQVHDLSHYQNTLKPPLWKLNVLEWFISFNNLIVFDEDFTMDYTISAHIEPSNELWELGRGPLKNIKTLFNYFRQRTLRNAYTTEALLWITPPGLDMSIPIPLETGIVELNTETNQIDIRVNRSELGLYGIAIEMDGFGLPARIGNSYAGFRYYQTPILRLPWQRISINSSIGRRLMPTITEQAYIPMSLNQQYSSYSEFQETLLATLNNQSVAATSFTLKDFDTWWITADTAPDQGTATTTVFLKPRFMDELRKGIDTFLSTPYTDNESVNNMLMMVQIDREIGIEQLGKISNTLVEQIETLDPQKTSISMEATSPSLMEYEINEVSMEANNIVIPLIFVVISLILLLSFRKLSYVIIPLIGLSISIVWLFGTMVLLGFPFIIMEIALIPMLMGLGVDYSVHLFHNYRVEIRKGKNPGKAIVTSIQDIGTAMLLATITTFIAFFSFLSASMIPLRDFGVLCAIGIAYTFIVAITFQAALRFIVDRRKTKPNNNSTQKKRFNIPIMQKLATIVCNHPLPILLTTLLITGVMVTGTLQIQTGFEMEDFLPADSPSVMVMTNIANTYPFSSQEKEYILIEGNIAQTTVLEDIYKTQQQFDDNSYILFEADGQPKINSILTIIDTAVASNQSLASAYNLDSRNIPQTDADVTALFNYLYDSSEYSFSTKELLHRNQNQYDATIITIYIKTTGIENADINEIMETIYTELNHDTKDSFTTQTATVTGDNSMFHVIMTSMTESQLLSTSISLVLAGLVLIIAYRKPVLGLIAMIPVSISTIWIVGTMYFIGYSLNVMTIMITSLTIGLGITYAIHAVERFRHTADKTGDVIGAVSETIGHTGGALSIAAITTIAGFLMLALTPMPVEQQFGIITALTILYALLTSLFILPPILMYWGRWQLKHKGYIISKGPPKKNQNNKNTK